MITHLKQPTATSCGPTCVAMLLHRPVNEVLAALPSVRTVARQRIKNHRTNVGELDRLLRRGGRVLGTIERIGPAGFRHTFGDFLLRIHNRNGRNWHWVVMSHGLIYDPMKTTWQWLTKRYLQLRRGRVSAYVILEPWGHAEVERLAKVEWPT